MNKCDHFRDLILTDYIDGQLDNHARLSMENHLDNCQDCRAFVSQVKNNAVGPLQQATREPVPSTIWEGIRENIQQIPQTHYPWEGIYDRLNNLFLALRLAPVFASFLLMFIAGSAVLSTLQVNQAKEKDQGEYLVSLLDTSGSARETDSNGLGTAIEHYFL